MRLRKYSNFDFKNKLKFIIKFQQKMTFLFSPFYFYTLGRHVAQDTLQIDDLTVAIQLNNTA